MAFRPSHRNDKGRSWLLGDTGAAGSEHVQLQVDPIRAGLDQEIGSLRDQVSKLKRVAGDIALETKQQNEILTQLEHTMAKARAAVRNTMRKVDRHLKGSGSAHLLHVILFALACFLFVYLWKKLS
ncbi:hypothetical protein CLOM_g20941 [Closterium sp. NIES-68]|nr:hypothetical protein CLOM_g20941 [Closterium sp. NIES-68]GJP80995.1 hypothetical protein CLOP_g11180 [Closterium sp. NIES-67]